MTKRSLKGLGAATIAVATLIAGLGLGPAASAGPLEPESDVERASQANTATVVLRNGSTYYALLANWKYGQYSSLSAANSAARKMKVVDAGGGWYRFTLDWNNYCATVVGRVFTSHGTCGSSSDVRLKGGKLVSRTLGTLGGVGSDRLISKRGFIAGNPGWDYVGNPGDMTIPTDLTASVQLVDHLAKTVRVTGRGTPDATVRANSTTTTVRADGAFDVTVPFTRPGPFTIDVTQIVAGEDYDSVRLSGTLVEGGTVVDVPQPAVELSRETATAVPFVVQNDEARTVASGTVTVTAPDGASFAPQSTAEASRRIGTTGVWTRAPQLDLNRGTVSADGKRLSFGIPSASRPSREQVRYLIMVTAAADAPEGTSSMPYVYAGTSSAGGFRAAGATPTSLTTARTYSTTYDPHDDAVTLTIVGGERNAAVFIEDENGENGNGGRDRTDAAGAATITLDAGTGALEGIRLKYGSTGDWETVPTGREPAISDPEVRVDKDGQLRVSGRVGAQADITISRSRLRADSVQTIRTAEDGSFSAPLNDAATALETAYLFQAEAGVRGRIDIAHPIESSIVDVPQPAVVLERGTSTSVPFVVRNDLTRTAMVGTVELSAPAGTTFTPGQDTVAVAYATGENDDWKPYPPLDLTDAVYSDDGTSVRFSLNTRGGNMVAGERYRYTLDVTTPADAPATTTAAMRYAYSGESSVGDYRATGATPVTIDEAAPTTFSVSSPLHESVVLTDSKRVTFTGTGLPGTVVAIVFGARTIGRVESVPADGRWSFTADMNYARYALTVFHRAPGMIGTAQQPLTITVRHSASDLPFAITGPLEGSVVGAPDKQVTFIGTGAPGGAVSVNNGPRVIGRIAAIPADGRWSFTAAMNYADYDLDVYYRSAPGSRVERTRFRLTVDAGDTPFSISTPGGSRFTAGSFAITGRGKPGGRVNAFLGSVSRGSAEVRADGTWRIPMTITTPGRHTVQVYYKDDPRDPTADATPLEIVVER